MGEAGRKSELRSSTRFHVYDAVTLVYRKSLLTVLGFGRVNEARAAVNLSEGGILIRSRNRVKSGTRVKVRLEIEKFKDVIEAAGVVRWCFQGTGDEPAYFAGIRFTRVPESALVKIRRLRGYFTSPEVRSRNAARRRNDPLGLETR
jgi:Tfp pilus assembly protein PilZ